MSAVIEISILDGFEEYAASAVTRLQYLFPDWGLSMQGRVIRVSADDPDASAILREVNYALYRERIRVEGAPLRDLLLNSVMA